MPCHASKWCGLWTSGQPTCTWCAVGPAASAADGVVTWCVIALAPEERSERHFSAHVEASECCWLEHQGAQRCSSQIHYRLTSLASVVCYVSDGLCVIVSRPRHCRQVLVEGQTSIISWCGFIQRSRLLGATLNSPAHAATPSHTPFDLRLTTYNYPFLAECYLNLHVNSPLENLLWQLFS